MKRRRLIQTLAGLPAITALPAPAQLGGSVPRAGTAESASLSITHLRIRDTAPDAVADSPPRFLNAPQYAALRKLAALLVPAYGGQPGALETEAPEFLDFLLSQSLPDRQRTYAEGLDRLNADAQRALGRDFAAVTEAEAGPFLAPLNAPWSYDPPADPLTRFLHEAKDDLLAATRNSRQWAESSRRRGAAGIGSYWLPLD